MAEAIKKEYWGGKPLHISKPEESVFKIMNKKTWAMLSSHSAHDILKTRCIVIPRHHKSASGFNKETWRRVLGCGLSRPLDVIGK